MNEGYLTSAVILAAGLGERMRCAVPKQELLLSGKSILSRALDAFACAKFIQSIVLVVREEELPLAAELLSVLSIPARAVVGGATRAESARNGVMATEADFVAIHDAARPLIAPSDIDRVVKAAYLCGAASAVLPVYDTVKTVDREGYIVSTVPREDLRLAATPQVFSRELYLKALREYPDGAPPVTDDNMLIEALGVRIAAVATASPNPKITTPSDLAYARFLLEERNE